MLNAQPQFVNSDFEQAPQGQKCEKNNIGLVGWTVGNGNDGATCNSEYVCNGSRSLELKDYYRETATVANPMAIPAPGYIPIAVRFKNKIGIQESEGLIKAYGTHSIGGAKTFLGQVSTAHNCEYSEIPMPTNVSNFSYFVLELEMNVGICWIDDIEVVYVSGCGGYPSYTVQNTTNWQTVADVEADSPGSIFGGEVYLSGLNIAEGKKLTIGGDITIHFSEGAHLLMWGGSELDLYGKLTSCDNFWGGVRTYSNSYFRSFWGSEIRNAVWGISSEEWGNYLGNATIECRDMRFINNAVAIHLYGPSASQNGYQLLLKNCGFIKDANYNPTRRFWGFISLNNMDTRIGSSGIYGCLFDNQNPTNTFNFGIEAYDSDFLVNSLNGNNTVFRNLGYGIFATRRGFARSYDVRNTDFNDCAVGIGNRRISSSIIARCNFNMGNVNPIYDGLLCCLGLNLQVGVSNNGVMTNLAIENNTFQSATQGLWTQGVNNYNVGTANNLVYLNSFMNLRHGNSAGNGAGLTNAQPNGSGLYYLCNTNQNNINSNLQWEYDFYARDLLSVRINQGDVAAQGSFAAARNTFSPGLGARHFDNTSPAYNVNYFALQNTPIEIPTEISNTTVTQTLLDHGCAAHFFKTDDPSEKMSQVEKEENESQYKNNLDAANTVKSEINAAKQSGNVALTKKKRGQYLYYRQLFEQAASKGLRNALIDKQGNDRSEIRMWLKRMDNQSADLLLVDDYIASGELEVAMNILDNMELKYDLTSAEIIDLDNIREIYSTIGRSSVDELTQSSIEMLKSMVETDGQASELAKSILGARGAYYPPVIVMKSDEASLSGNQPDDETMLKMSVSPNPADYLVTFDWSIFDAAGKTVRIEITNKMGALVKVLEPMDNATALNWTTEAVSDGICYYRLLIDNQVVDSGHIFVTK